MNDVKKRALDFHSQYKGKLQIAGKVPLDTPEDLGMVYTPGMAYPCMEIAEDKSKAYDYTLKATTVAIVTDGTAVLGFGDIGPEAAMPVMEGKALVFKKFANIDAYPLCLDTKEVDDIVMICKNIAPGFGGIHLEDIAAPACFEIEDRLKEELDIPVFHDDQHGTAIVALAGMINALKVVGKTMEDSRFVINGAGAAGIAVAKILVNAGASDVILLDSKGTLFKGRDGMNKYKTEVAEITNPRMVDSDLAEAMKDADVFLGVSKADLVSEEMVKSMAKDPIIFAMANPVPEILPEKAIAAGAAVVGTGRADYPNQVNNVLAFPGIFKGALDARATDITEAMKVAAAHAIAAMIKEPRPDYIIPGAFEPGLADKVAEAVREVA
jgi:malate dehydrogenase (oxaloacetate-decarboxylating)